MLRTVSDPVNLRFLDILSANVDDPTVNDFLTTVQDDDCGASWKRALPLR